MRVAFLFPVLLTACAGVVQVGSPGPDPVPTTIGEGEVPTNRIVVYRPSEIGLIPNVGTSPALSLNGDVVGTCRTGFPLVLRVPAGVWEIGAATESGAVTEAVTVGQETNIYIRCGTETTPSFGPKPVLMPVSEDRGQSEAGI